MSFRPVDLRFGQNIIANYLASIESQQKGKELELQKERLDQEKELEEKRLEQQHVFEQGQLENLQGHLELAQTQQRHDLTNKYLALAAQGVEPPGGSVEKPQLSTPSQESGMQPISQTLGLGTEQQRVNLPPELNTPPVTMLNPLAAARLRGAAGLAEEAPKLEAERQKQEEIGQRNLEIEFLRLQQKTLQDTMDRTSRETVARGQNAARIDAARMTQFGELQRGMLHDANTRIDTSPTTRDFNTLKLANENAQNSSSDLELLISYEKALNPSTTVSTKSADALIDLLPISYAEKLKMKLNSLTNPKSFIPTKLGDQLKTEIGNRFKLQGGAYNNLRTSEASKLRQIGVTKPEDFLTDYSKDIKSGPQVGDTVKIGGKNIKITKIHPDGTFDGDEVK